MMFYNSNVKDSFLNNFAENSSVTYSYIFKKSTEIEKLVGEDLYSFDINQIEIFLKNIKPKTKNVSRSNGRIVSSYLNWAYQNGLRSNENPLKNVGNDFFDKLVVLDIPYLTEKAVNKIEKRLVNPQDKLIIRLLFIGVQGEELCELCNLKKEDIQEDSIVLTDDKGNQRSINVTHNTISLIESTINEDKYYSKNGKSIGNRAISTLMKNDYVIRPATRKGTPENAPISKFVLYRRIKMIEDILNLKNLTTGLIVKSGMIKMANDLYDRDKDLDNKQLDEIVNLYNVEKFKVNGYWVTNYTALKEYLNLSTIQALYK